MAYGANYINYFTVFRVLSSSSEVVFRLLPAPAPLY